MKKTKKWPSLLAAAFIVLSFGSCQEWGEMDPPAGNQVYATLKQVVHLSFDEEELDPATITTFAYENGEVPFLEEDSELGQVLHLPGGYARIYNPLGHAEDGVSLTFWVKQHLAEAEGDEEVPEQDLTGALFAFENENATSRLFFTANGWLRYEGMDGEYEENNPATVKTGMMSPNEWHYVAVSITKSGYFVYVDGMRKIDKTEVKFDCSKLVQFMANAPTIYIGYGADSPTQEMWVDDVKIYRNMITSREINVPKKGSGAEEVDLSKWILVGADDNSTPFWSAWSDYVNLTGNGTIHYEFYNFGSGANNWNNWVLAITNGVIRNGEGYEEYLILRNDHFGWGTLYESTTLTSEYNWDTFISEMNGAHVDMDITRYGSTVTVKAVITAESGNVYHYTAVTEGVTSETIGTFFTVDSSHLYFNPNATFVGQLYDQGTNVTGNTDCSTGWWSVWSPLNRFDNLFDHWGVEFVNGNTGTGSNWNNWLLVCTNGLWVNEAGYHENFVLRSDAFGWGDFYEASTMTSGFNWDTYVSDMHNANCRIYFTYDGSNLTMVARQTTEAGEAMPEYRFVTPGLTLPIGLFFTCELAYLDFLKIGYFPWVDMNPQQ